MAEENAERIYIIYDERARILSIEAARVLHATLDLEEGVRV
jgi:hypothetical protein